MASTTPTCDARGEERLPSTPRRGPVLGIAFRARCGLWSSHPSQQRAQRSLNTHTYPVHLPDTWPMQPRGKLPRAGRRPPRMGDPGRQ
eukprot:6521469-Alexandrium_andersonii.AAC.1